MSRLFLAIHAMAMAVLMGSGITAVLAMNLPGWKPIAVAALVGFVVSFPAAWVVTNRIETATR
ncbi:MAG: hypothetical protein ACKOPE_02970 [Novosphingobium sp.]